MQSTEEGGRKGCCVCVCVRARGALTLLCVKLPACHMLYGRLHVRWFYLSLRSRQVPSACFFSYKVLLRVMWPDSILENTSSSFSPLLVLLQLAVFSVLHRLCHLQALALIILLILALLCEFSVYSFFLCGLLGILVS